MSNHHYYATCAFGWATADTLDGAITKLVKRFRSDVQRCTRNTQKEGQPGCYVWTCRVHEPADASYKIEWYAPQGVKISEVSEWSITKVTTKVIEWTPWVKVTRVVA